MGRWQANRMIDGAEKGSFFFRFVISPDPKQEDRGKDLFLRDITEQTMLRLEDRFQKPLQWVAVEHNDHTPLRHVHVVAVVPGKLTVQDFQALRHTATETALEQRKQRDLIQERQMLQEREAQWDLQR